LDKLNCIVVGVGHLGKHHARILASLPNVELMAVVDTDRRQGREVADRHNTRFLPDISQLDGDIDAAVIAAPTSEHFRLASCLLDKGVSVLVEKPITNTVEQADALIALAQKKGAQLHVGHIERFNPAVLAIRKHITQPLYIECDRIASFGFRCMDVGVVLDLMIHDIDMALYLTGSEIAHIDAIGVAVISQQEDVANARIRFENGCIANLTASRVATRRERKMRVFQADAYFSLDSEAREARIYRRSADFVPPEQIDLSKVDDPKALVFEKMLIAEQLPTDDQDPLEAELEAFVNCVQTGADPEVSGTDGRKAIAAAAEIVRQIKHQRRGPAE